MKGYLYELTRDCLGKVDQILSVERVRMDFLKFMEFEKSKERLVNAFDENGGTKEISILKNDRITIISKKIAYGDVRLVHIPLQVTIGIGKFFVEDGLYSIEKCTGELMYNDAFELVDIDFYYQKLFDLNLMSVMPKL